MLSLIAAMMMYPPIDMIETNAVAEVPYEFAFAPNAEETPSQASERLETEALDYCRDVTRVAGVPDEAAACARLMVDQVTAALAEARRPVFAAN